MLAALLTARLLLQDVQRLHDAIDAHADEHHRRLLEPLRAFVRLAQVQGREVQDRGLLGDRAAVGEHGAGIGLQPDVVEEPERLVELHLRRDAGA